MARLWLSGINEMAMEKMDGPVFFPGNPLLFIVDYTCMGKGPNQDVNLPELGLFPILIINVL
jgi:hypothetical protein